MATPLDLDLLMRPVAAHGAPPFHTPRARALRVLTAPSFHAAVRGHEGRAASSADNFSRVFRSKVPGLLLATTWAAAACRDRRRGSATGSACRGSVMRWCTDGPLFEDSHVHGPEGLEDELEEELVEELVPITIAGENPGAELDIREHARLGRKVEVLAPSKRWRKAKVKAIEHDGLVVHYMGYDAQFNEFIAYSSGRLRPSGELSAQDLANRKAAFKTETKTRKCPGCGVMMQCDNPYSYGYTPKSKLDENNAQDVATLKPLKAEDEVMMLLQGAGGEDSMTPSSMASATMQATFKVVANVLLDIRKEPDINAELQGTSLSIGQEFSVREVKVHPDGRNYLRLTDGRGWVFDWAEVNGARIQLVAPVQDGWSRMKALKNNYRKVCQRCWALWNYNDCDSVHRPGFGKQAMPELTADKFQGMLEQTLADVNKAEVIAVVDLFDFGPSRLMLEFLAQQIANKPNVRVRVVANKIDLLPKDTDLLRIRGWVFREAKEAGIDRLRLTEVYPVSCHKGAGTREIGELLQQVNAAKEWYLVGAANAGKSSLINRMSLKRRKAPDRLPARAADGFTVSACPGTTLAPQVVKFATSKMKLVDMPGLLVPGSFASRLTMQELKAIIPQKEDARRVSFFLDQGRSILLGGLAQVTHAGGRECYFTVFFAYGVKLHKCSAENAEEYCERYVGRALTPPFSKDRYRELLPWETHRFTIQGNGWMEAAADVVIHGLGWVCITGGGVNSPDLEIEVKVPKGVSVSVRKPLMPYEARWTGVKYLGRPGWFKHGRVTTTGANMGRTRKQLFRRNTG